jgi:hypothetical protein
MVTPPQTGETLRPVFSALRNHFRLVEFYNPDLDRVAARISNIDLIPSTGVPGSEEPSLDGWDKIRGFATEPALCYQLLRTFLPEALKDDARCSTETLARFPQASLEDVDLRLMRKCDGSTEPRTPYERTFESLLEPGP